jgi:hypothetical protein
VTNESAVGAKLRTVPRAGAESVPTAAVTVQLPSAPAKSWPGVSPKLQTPRSLEL